MSINLACVTASSVLGAKPRFQSKSKTDSVYTICHIVLSKINTDTRARTHRIFALNVNFEKKRKENSTRKTISCINGFNKSVKIIII